MTKYVRPNYRGEKYKKIIHDAAENGEIRAFVDNPQTGLKIRVHPDLIKKMRNGERVTIDDIKNKKFD
jgi:hypothetical protein